MSFASRELVIATDLAGGRAGRDEYSTPVIERSREAFQMGRQECRRQ